MSKETKKSARSRRKIYSLNLKMKAVHFSESPLDITELHGVTTQNTAHFIVTPARTSDPTTILTSKTISALTGYFPLNVVISGDAECDSVQSGGSSPAFRGNVSPKRQ
jgi:hypothetical protein